MLKKLLSTTAITFAFIGGCIALGLAQNAKADSGSLTFVAGKAGGLWYPLGATAKNIIEKSVKGTSVSLKPGNGIGNIVSVSNGKADLGWTMVLSANEAIKGVGAFAKRGKHDKICNMGVLYANIVHLMSVKPSIKALKDLKGKAIGTLARGSTTEYATQSMLSLNGLQYSDLKKVNHASYGDQANMIKDGQIDVMTGVTGVGTGAFLDVATARDVNLVPISDAELAKLKANNAGWQRMVIPAGTYRGQKEDIKSAGFNMHLIGHCTKISEDLGYKITKAIAENITEFGAVKKSLARHTAKKMAIDVGIPYHPGALRYYKEVGAL